MNERKVVPMTPELRERWQRAVQETEAELPELLDLGKRLHEAAREETISGYLRRAIHHSTRTLAELSAAVGIPLSDLNAFLSGDHTLRSDVLDRLALAVDFTKSLQQVGKSPQA